jgi:hypothetical protein
VAVPIPDLIGSLLLIKAMLLGPGMNVWVQADMWIKKMLLHEGGEEGILHGLHTIVAPLLEVTGIFLPPCFTRTLNKAA